MGPARSEALAPELSPEGRELPLCSGNDSQGSKWRSLGRELMASGALGPPACRAKKRMLSQWSENWHLALSAHRRQGTKTKLPKGDGGHRPHGAISIY